MPKRLKRRSRQKLLNRNALTRSTAGIHCLDSFSEKIEAKTKPVMNRFQKFLFFAPVFAAFELCDKTLADFFKMMIGGLIFWIPYWLAWWLSDGFALPEGSPGRIKSRYKLGPHGFGFYHGNVLIHR